MEMQPGVVSAVRGPQGLPLLAESVRQPRQPASAVWASPLGWRRQRHVRPDAPHRKRPHEKTRRRETLRRVICECCSLARYASGVVGNGLQALPDAGAAQGRKPPRPATQPREPPAGRRRGHRDRLRAHGPLQRTHDRRNLRPCDPRQGSGGRPGLGRHHAASTGREIQGRKLKRLAHGECDSNHAQRRDGRVPGGAGKRPVSAGDSPTTLPLTAEGLVAASRCKHKAYTRKKPIIALIGGTLGGLSTLLPGQFPTTPLFRLHPLQQARTATNPRRLILKWPASDRTHGATDQQVLSPSSPAEWDDQRCYYCWAEFSNARRPCRAPVLCRDSHLGHLVLRIWPDLYHSYVRWRRAAGEHSRNVRQP